MSVHNEGRRDLLMGQLSAPSNVSQTVLLKADTCLFV